MDNISHHVISHHVVSHDVPHAGPADAVRVLAWVEGRVQGVGFRWWTRCRALELGLVGRVENLSDGRVRVLAEGSRAATEQLVGLLRSAAAPGRVRAVRAEWEAARGGLEGFAEA